MKESEAKKALERLYNQSSIDGKAYLVHGNGKSSLDKPFSASPSKFTALDADPIKPTVANLLPGMIAEVNGRLSICTKQFALVDLADGGHHSPTPDTPITGKVWRFTGQQQPV